MSKLTREAKLIEKVILRQIEKALAAAVSGETLDRAVLGISIERNLKLLAVECERARIAKKKK